MRPEHGSSFRDVQEALRTVDPCSLKIPHTDGDRQAIKAEPELGACQFRARNTGALSRAGGGLFGGDPYGLAVARPLKIPPKKDPASHEDALTSRRLAIPNGYILFHSAAVEQQWDESNGYHRTPFLSLAS